MYRKLGTQKISQDISVTCNPNQMHVCVCVCSAGGRVSVTFEEKKKSKLIICLLIYIKVKRRKGFLGGIKNVGIHMFKRGKKRGGSKDFCQKT